MSREAMKMALNALETPHPSIRTDFSDAMVYRENVKAAIEALRTALAQPDVPETAFGETEPVAWVSHNAGLYHGKPDESLNPLPLYLAPPRREWVGLTDDEYELMAEKRVTNYFFNTLDYAHDIEAKLKEKNT